MFEKLTLRRIRHGLYWRFCEAWSRAIVVGCRVNIWLRSHMPLRQAAHNLPGELIISLTSYAARFGTLRPTLEALLCQSVKPDRVILWLDEGDAAHLPANIKALTTRGLTIIETPEAIGPYKKIIPALARYPQAFIATTDDDVYCRPHWLRDLVRGWSGNMKQIVCHRAHCPTYQADGSLKAYTQWQHEAPGPQDGPHLFPTGVAGVLYPPGVLGAEALTEAHFMQHCPRADDVWLYWMALRNGATYHLTTGHLPLILWPGSQATTLMSENVSGGGNDSKIAAMAAQYGLPAREAA